MACSTRSWRRGVRRWGSGRPPGPGRWLTGLKAGPVAMEFSWGISLVRAGHRMGAIMPVYVRHQTPFGCWVDPHPVVSAKLEPFAVQVGRWNPLGVHQFAHLDQQALGATEADMHLMGFGLGHGLAQGARQVVEAAGITDELRTA